MVAHHLFGSLVLILFFKMVRLLFSLEKIPVAVSLPVFLLASTSPALIHELIASIFSVDAIAVVLPVSVVLVAVMMVTVIAVVLVAIVLVSVMLIAIMLVSVPVSVLVIVSVLSTIVISVLRVFVVIISPVVASISVLVVTILILTIVSVVGLVLVITVLELIWREARAIVFELSPVEVVALLVIVIARSITKAPASTSSTPGVEVATTRREVAVVLESISACPVVVTLGR